MKKPTKQKVHFAVCINNNGYEVSLELGKFYRIMPDEKAQEHGYIRVLKKVARTAAIH